MTTPTINRFNTGHYADLAQQHADVVEALNNELQLAVARLAEIAAQRDDLLEQVASLKKQCAEHAQAITLLRKRDPMAGAVATPMPEQGGRN